MIDHLSTAVANIEEGRAFYDATLAALGATRLMNFDREGVHISGYGRDRKPTFWIAQYPDGQAASRAGHIAFAALDRAAVDAFHRAALAGGATDNGAPGPRPQYHENYYAGFVIDPDGNRLEAVCHAPA